MKPRIHQSQMNTLFRCGMQYFKRYVEGLIVPPSISMIRGTGTHAAVGKNLIHKRDTGALLDRAEVADAARDAVNAAWGESGAYLTEEDRTVPEKLLRGQAVQTAISLAQCHHAELAPALQPVHIERPFRLEHPDLAFDLQGTIDLQEPGTLRDLKTSSKSPAKGIADSSMQLTFYSMAINALDKTPPERICLDYAVSTKTPKIVTQETTRGPDDWRQLLDRANAMYDAIQKGVFLPTNPDNWVCSEKYCGYWKDACPYGRKNRKRVTA